MRYRHGKSTRRYRPPASGLTYRMAGKLYEQACSQPRGYSLEPGTWLRKEGQNYSIWLDDTKLVTIHPDNSYTITALSPWAVEFQPWDISVKVRNRIATWTGIQLSRQGSTWICSVWRRNQCHSYPFFNGIRIARNGTCLNEHDCPPSIRSRYATTRKRSQAMRTLAMEIARRFPDATLNFYCQLLGKYIKQANRNVLYFFDGLWGFAIDRRQESPYIPRQKRWYSWYRGSGYIYCWAWNKLGQTWQGYIPTALYQFRKTHSLPTMRKKLGEMLERIIRCVPELAAEYAYAILTGDIPSYP